jgi:death-on-curing protein
VQVEFLALQDILEIHAEQLALHGGREGFVDQTVVESAIAMPKQAMFGEYLHENIPAMAAAYLFHLAVSQGFTDGNKRTALLAAVAFLARNGYKLGASNDEIYAVTMRIANHEMDKSEIADWIGQRIITID